MTGRRRTGILALLALAVPLPASALDGDGETTAPAGLSVSAALDRCGVADSAILCKIDAGWSQIQHADTYLVSVTRSDGSVIDFGSTGAAMTSVWVPYAGPGIYKITIEAWGTPPAEANGEPELIARATSASPAGGATSTNPGEKADAPGAGREAEAPAREEPADTPHDEPPVADEPVCEEPVAPAAESPDEPVAATIPACPTPPSSPLANPPGTSWAEGPESSSSEDSG